MLWGLVLLASIAAGWWTYHSLSKSEREDLTWWHLTPSPHDFFEAPAPQRISAKDLADGLRYSLNPSVNPHEPLTPAEILERARFQPYPRLSITPEILVTTQTSKDNVSALLSGTHLRTIVGIPRVAASRTHFAAAGAGVLATEITNVSESTIAKATRPDKGITVHPAPAWMIGLDAAGAPVNVQLIPGSTILLHGGVPDHLLDRLPPECSWVRVIRGDVPTDPPADQWRQAWSSSICRIVVLDSFQDATRLRIIHDLSIDARGLVEHRGRRIEFSPLRMQSAHATQWGQVDAHRG